MLSSYSSYSIHLILKSHVGPIHMRVVPSTAFAISDDDKYLWQCEFRWAYHQSRREVALDHGLSGEGGLIFWGG